MSRWKHVCLHRQRGTERSSVGEFPFSLCLSLGCRGKRARFGLNHLNLDCISVWAGILTWVGRPWYTWPLSSVGQAPKTLDLSFSMMQPWEPRWHHQGDFSNFEDFPQEPNKTSKSSPWGKKSIKAIKKAQKRNTCSKSPNYDPARKCLLHDLPWTVFFPWRLQQQVALPGAHFAVFHEECDSTAVCLKQQSLADHDVMA